MRNIIDLPEECIEHILSLTSPKDVLLSTALVSKQFLSVSSSDAVWAKLLPPDWEGIISRASTVIPRDQIGFKKDLFIYLCRFPILLENNTTSFALDKWSGKTCYMLGARALSIIWGSSPEYWSWESIPGSRFPECAVLENVCWLDIRGKIHATLLSPSTEYAVYFVFKFKVDSVGGFERTPVKVSISELSEDGLPMNSQHTPEIKQFFLKAQRSRPAPRVQRRGSGSSPTRELPVARSDEWMEIEMGRYRVGDKVDGQSAVLEMALKEVEILHWKRGLIVHGIELRPVL
ncbi:hypothetical protein vseg_013904 [Gypsophila vaccaria]